MITVGVFVAGIPRKAFLADAMTGLHKGANRCCCVLQRVGLVQILVKRQPCSLGLALHDGDFSDVLTSAWFGQLGKADASDFRPNPLNRDLAGFFPVPIFERMPKRKVES